MGDKAYCAYWGGYCKAVMTDDMRDAQKEKARWIKQGAEEIRLLPREEAKAEIGRWLSSPERAAMDRKPEKQGSLL